MTQTGPSTNWPTTSREEAFWQEIREQYMIGQDVIYLNTASFGSQPRSVFECLSKSLDELERIAGSFTGVSKSYAIQAGRELRIIVESEKISDAEAVLLSRDVAKKIEESMSYPGQIRVTVIRETRAVDFAK